jgi:DNA repair exonuclease SbcCD nuclease subunit
VKIAITADLHLTTRDLNPERYETLENLLLDLRSKGVETLIIAGDLFDASLQNYAEFERVCRHPENRVLSITIIPGNHDPGISSRDFSAGNLTIIDTPSLLDLDGRLFLLLPYQSGKTMGEEIEPFRDQLPPNEWVLIGHGDWTLGLRTPNPLEPGTYMPLTRKDIGNYKPAHVFLGHIHAPMEEGRVHYPGSPLGLDITETGRRKYLIYDTTTDTVETPVVKSPVLYFDESFIILPVEDEIAYLRQRIKDRIQNWALEPEEHSIAELRVKVRGYSADKSTVQKVIQEEFAGFSFYKGEEPDIDEVNISTDLERHYIAEKVMADLSDVSWSDSKDKPSNDDILVEALKIIYGG